MLSVNWGLNEGTLMIFPKGLRFGRFRAWIQGVTYCLSLDHGASNSSPV